MKFEIDESFLTSVNIYKEWSMFQHIDPDDLTPDQVFKMIKGEDRCSSQSSEDHPEFAKLRDSLEQQGFIKTQRNCWNGDDVIKTFTFNGNNQVQYEGIRCESFQWRLYGTFESGAWKENPLSSWNIIKDHTPNRYQAALAQGAFCNFNSQEKGIKNIIQSLNPEGFTGGTKPTNSFGFI